MRRTTTIVIGAGHAGLAMSRRLTERSIDHVVLERGEVANSWRTERWPGLRLLTPNWQATLPGQPYTGGDPDGFLPVGAVVDLVTGYATAIDAPVITNTAVQRLRPCPSGYEVITTRGVWRAATVVIASGANNIAVTPSCAEAIRGEVTVTTPLAYRGPERLPDGGVLVVGASASGVQLAQEIQRSGRPVTLSVGEHVRLPRTYRGRDIFWWMDRSGLFDERYDEVDDLVRARHVPSPQLIGTPERSTVDLNQLRGCGVRIVGRLSRIHESVADFSGSLTNVVNLADLKQTRLLDRLDEWARHAGVDDGIGAPERFEPTIVDERPILTLELGGAIRTVVFATGYRPDYTWLDVPVLDRRSRIRHTGGVVDAPGLYVLGLPYLRRRRSTFLHGAASDTADLAAHLHQHLDQQAFAPI